MKKGLFITFEGIDGSGKSTQARNVFHRLKDLNYPVILTREPGGLNAEISEKIRNLILSKANIKMAPHTELFLFMASRTQHIAEVIEPSLEKGIIVICDRYADASVAYQGYGRGLDINWINQLNLYVCDKVWPTKTYLLDIPPGVFTSRKKDKSAPDRIEIAGEDFQGKIRKGYLEIAEGNKHRFLTLDGTKTEEELTEIIFKDLKKIIDEKSIVPVKKKKEE